MNRCIVFFALSLLCVGSVVAQEPLGEQFQVNQDTVGFQRYPEAAVAADGSFVVVWQAGDEAEIFDDFIRGQRFDSLGMAVGAELEINDLTFAGQRNVSVASDPAGNFMVVWQSDYSTGSDTHLRSIQGRRYGSDGTPEGSQFQVNTLTLGDQSYPHVDASDQGTFTVTWIHDYAEVHVQRFGSDGEPVGQEIVANEVTDFKYTAKLAHTSDGGFVVTWADEHSNGTDNSDAAALARRFGPDGQALGPEFQVNTTIDGWQGDPNIAVATDDSFVIMFSSNRYTGQGGDVNVYGQRFAADGTRVGSEFAVETELGNFEVLPTVVPMPGGGFFAAWEIYSFPVLGKKRVLGQLFDQDGQKVGERLEVPTLADGGEQTPHVGTNDQGDLVVVWMSDGSMGSDSSETSIQGQRLGLTVVFRDGFETGDLSAWSGR